MKKLALLALLVLVSGCVPVLDELGQEFQQAAQQQHLQAKQQRLQVNAPIPRAQCFARDGVERINRLQQGPNLCTVSALAPSGMGELQRMRVVVQYSYPDRAPVRKPQDFSAADLVFNGERIAFPHGFLLPDSLTGAIVAAALGLGKLAVPAAYNAFLTSMGLPPTFSMSQVPAFSNLLDPQGNFKDAQNRFGNLGTRPSAVLLQFQICSDVCVLSHILTLETR